VGVGGNQDRARLDERLSAGRRPEEAVAAVIMGLVQWPFAVKVAAVAISAATVGGGAVSAVIATGSPSEPGVATYLCAGSGTDLLLQWRQDGSDLTGTYELAQLAGTAPSEQVSSNHGGLSGTLDGQAVTLSVGFSQPLYGRLADSTLTLNVPQQDGTIQAATCSQAGIAAWNKTVASLDSQASSDNDAANRAQAQQQHDQAVSQAQQSLASDAPKLAQDASALDNDKSLGATITQMQSDYGQEQRDWQAEQADNCSNLGSDSATVGADNASVSADSASEQSAAAAVGDSITGLQSDLSAVQGDEGTLQNLGATPATDASSAIKAGNAALSSANNAVSWANGQASTISGQATDLDDTAGNYSSQHGC
jgi:hypothetical protein